MSDEFDLFFKIFDSLGTFGLMALALFAMFKGWVIPITVLAQQNEQRYRDDDEIRTLHKQIEELLQNRITDLEKLLAEREARVEQGVQLLSMFVEAQDTLSKVADHLSEGPKA